MKEADVEDEVTDALRGDRRQVQLKRVSGRSDIITPHLLIEIKRLKHWELGVEQLNRYDRDPEAYGRRKVLYLFDDKEADKRCKPWRDMKEKCGPDITVLMHRKDLPTLKWMNEHDGDPPRRR